MEHYAEINLFNAAVSYARAFKKCEGDMFTPALRRARKTLMERYEAYEQWKARERAKAEKEHQSQRS